MNTLVQKKHLIGIILVLINTVGFAQNQTLAPEQIRHFKGDSLDGFDFNKAYQLAVMEKMDNSRELSVFMYKMQSEFVASKYNIPVSTSSRGIKVLSTLTSSCNNVDFENGNFTGWVGSIGYNKNSNAALTITAAGINTLGLNSSYTSCSYHTLVSALAGNNFYGGFPQLDPAGGTYAVRLGGQNINQYHGGACVAGSGNGITTAYSGGEVLQQTFTVNASNALLTYKYAVILNDGGHTNGNQPYFKIEVLDNLGNPIPCLQYYIQASAGTPPAGFLTSAKTNPNDLTSVYYLPWTSNSLNLSAYIGQTITVRFSAAGCTAGAHFGYGYFDASCSPLQVISTSNIICPGSTNTLTAPPGAQSYNWAKIPAGAGIVGATNTQACAVNKTGRYEVTVTSSAGCTYVIDTTLTADPLLKPKFGFTKGCPGIPVTFTDSSQSLPQIASWKWDFGAYGISTLQIPPVVNFVATGTYPVKLTLTSLNGCQHDTTINIPIVSCALLPIEMLSFNAIQQNVGEVNLKWITASEKNAAYFVVERSIDGVKYEEIGLQRAAGNSITLKNYSYIDKKASIGLNYYRLKQADNNGEITFSKIVSINLNSGGGSNNISILTIHPVPAKDVITYIVNSNMEGNIVAEIVDMTGRLIKQEKQSLNLGKNELTATVSDLTNGIYFLRLSTTDGQFIVQRFVK